MSNREIKITKYEGNTHFSVNVIDKYGTEHHVGYYKHIYTNKIWEKAKLIWQNEVKPKQDLLANAIHNCIELDKKRGVEPKLD